MLFGGTLDNVVKRTVVLCISLSSKRSGSNICLLLSAGMYVFEK